MTEPRAFPGNHCVVHRYHWPKPARTVRHHIKPQQYGGKSTPENEVEVCDTGHYNIHEYLDALLAGKVVPKVTREEKRLAVQGFTEIRNTSA